MDAFIIYIIKSAIYFTAFYICIKAFVSNETFFRFNRWAILIGSVVCFLLPLINIKAPTFSTPVLETPIMVLERTLNETAFATITPIEEEVVIINAETTNISPAPIAPIRVAMIIFIIYLIGLFINFIILSRSIYMMANLIRKGQKQKYTNYTLVLIAHHIVPFSWGKYIVLSESDYQDNPKEIITHEMAHTRHQHSIDLIFMEAVLLLQWFNPAIWLLKKELKDIHEYQADISVLQSGIDATKYQLLLVKKAVGASSYTLANSFNHSKIKKRITMMLKIRSNKWARLKLLLLLPLGTLTVFAFARPEVNEPLSSLVEYESTNILSDTKAVESEPVLQDVKTEQQKKKKPNHYNFDHYLIDGKKVSKEEYEKIKKNSLEIMALPYVPFAKGKVIYITGVFNTGEEANHTYVREMFVDGKAPDRSHVEYIVDGKSYSFEEGWNKSSGITYSNLEDAKKGAKSAGTGTTPLKCQIVSKDGSKSSPAFYTVRFSPPPPPPLRDKKKEAGKKDMEIEDVEGRKAAEKKANTPPPPPIKKGNVIIVEDVEGKKGTNKNTTPPPPPPPLKKNKGVTIEDLMKIQDKEVDPKPYGIDVSSKNVGDTIKGRDGYRWVVASKSPPKIKIILLKSTIQFVPPAIKKDANTEKKKEKSTVQFVPPVIKKEANPEKKKEKSTVKFVSPVIKKDANKVK